MTATVPQGIPNRELRRLEIPKFPHHNVAATGEAPGHAETVGGFTYVQVESTTGGRVDRARQRRTLCIRSPRAE